MCALNQWNLFKIENFTRIYFLLWINWLWLYGIMNELFDLFVAVYCTKIVVDYTHAFWIIKRKNKKIKKKNGLLFLFSTQMQNFNGHSDKYTLFITDFAKPIQINVMCLHNYLFFFVDFCFSFVNVDLRFFLSTAFRYKKKK